jgi:hypothetical protein
VFPLFVRTIIIRLKPLVNTFGLSLWNEVKGFMPVERKTAGACIDNYYLAGDSSELLTSLIEKAKEEFAQDCTLYAISHVRHVDAFRACGFSELKTWKLYVKMVYEANGESEKQCV